MSYMQRLLPPPLPGLPEAPPSDITAFATLGAAYEGRFGPERLKRETVSLRLVDRQIERQLQPTRLATHRPGTNPKPQLAAESVDSLT